MPPKRAAVSRQPADAISEVLNSQNFMGEYALRPPYKSVLRTLIIKILYKKAWLGNACSPALPVPEQLPYPGYATDPPQLD